MATVKELALKVKQPRGGFINPSLMNCSIIDDGVSLNPDENIYGGTVGTVVDYMTRVIGYLKRISSFAEPRQKEANIRAYKRM